MSDQGNGVSDMHPIGAVRARVESAGGLPETLAAGWDAFELMRAAAERCSADPGDPGPLFAAFILSAASAANGRDAVLAAPALPRGEAAGIAAGDAGPGDLDHVADELAALASALTTSLLAAGRGAADPADRAACAHAANEAGKIRELLARDE
jgi:hypothetical protein